MMTKDPKRISYEAIRTAIDFGPPHFSIENENDIDRYIRYIVSLMEGSEQLFLAKHFNLATFTAITAIEETVRAHTMPFRERNYKRTQYEMSQDDWDEDENRSNEKKKGRDPLYDHAHKHKAAVQYTFMGSRMLELFGSKEAADKFHRKVNSGYLKEMREKSLYCFAGKKSFICPTEYIDIEKARIILLVAIETIDDIFCGLTDYSFISSERFDLMFDRIKNYKRT